MKPMPEGRSLNWLFHCSWRIGVVQACTHESTLQLLPLAYAHAQCGCVHTSAAISMLFDFLSDCWVLSVIITRNHTTSQQEGDRH